jgi:hypothetical protein
MKRLLILVVAITTLMTVMIGSASAGASKTDVCHYDADADAYHLINISDNAIDKHIEHGDVAPDTYEIGDASYLDEDCSLVSFDAYGDVLWTNWNGSVTGIHTVFSLFAGTATDYTDGSGTVEQTTGNGTITVTVACVKIDGNELNWGGYVTASDDATKPVTTDIVGWANDGGSTDMIGSWADSYPGNDDPCSDLALAWPGEGTVTDGDLVIN